MFEKPNQQIHFCLHGMGTFLCGVPIFVRVLINTIKMGVYVHSWMLTVLTRTYAPPFCPLDLAKSMGGAYN